MIIVKITGGLGNQLFQYAVGRAVAIHHQVPLKVDIIAYDTYKLHNGYRLEHFNIKAQIANVAEIVSLKGSNSVLHRVLRKLGLVKRKTYYAEKQRTIYDAEVFSESDRYLDGYWQTEKYFLGIRELLLKELSPKKPLSSKAQIHQQNIQRTNAVSIHIRRGDYLKHPDIGVLDARYYKQAVEHIKVNVESPAFFVFSNDLAWCKSNLNFLRNPTYIEGTQSEVEDLVLMSHCQHNIIANSSFSWWAAWLNQKTNKIVIAPKKWMASNPNCYKWIPNSWVEM